MNGSEEKPSIGMERSIVLTKYIYPVILFLYPLLSLGKGADLTDTSYSLGNYMFIERMDIAWKYATFLSNYLGRVFYLLTDGRMLWMQLLCLMVIAAIDLCVYYMLGRYVSKHILFIGELIALGLCWIPAVILYNYLTYLLFTLGALFIYKGAREGNNRYYVIAGLFLGVNVFARTSNVVEVVLIVVVWVAASQKEKAFWKDTLSCVAGYAIGAVVGILMMLISGGVNGIVKMVNWLSTLLTSSDDAGGYSAGGMLGTILSNYIKNLKWPVLIMLGTLAGIVIFKLLKGRLLLLSKIGYLGCVALLFTYFYRNGCFLSDYRNVSSVFGISATLYILYFGIFIYLAFKKNVSFNNKLLYLMGGIIIIITPLGSNNHLFACINNMFVVAPVFVAMLYEVLVELKNSYARYPVAIMAAVFVIVYLLQSSLLHMDYVFRDSVDGQPRDTIIDRDCTLKGMRTNADNARAIDELLDAFDDIEEDSLLLYGNIPGVSYITRRPAAISSTWPDLDSYSAVQLKDELGLLDASNMPVIVISNETESYFEALVTAESINGNEEKLDIIADFIEEHGYVCYKQLDKYTIYQIER